MDNVSTFTDNFQSRYSFSYEFVVICPKCSKRAKVIPVTSLKQENFFYAERKLICTNCGLNKHCMPSGTMSLSVDVDWFFQLPLFYAIGISDGTLYAYNDAHLESLEQFIAAKIRTRIYSEEYGWSNKSQISRLPKWVKEAKNRDKLLHAIAKLRQKR